MMVPLTDKQMAALRAVGAPTSTHGLIWWEDARRNWLGPRKTLGFADRA